MRFIESNAKLRTSYQYNNLMYGMLSYVSEVIGGSTWEDLMTSKLFQPMGMNGTTFTHVVDQTRGDIAKPYLIDFWDGQWRATSLKLHGRVHCIFSIGHWISCFITNSQLILI